MSTAIDYLAAVRKQAEVVRKIAYTESLARDHYNRTFARWSGLSDALAAVVSVPAAYEKVERLERLAHVDLANARAQLDRCAADTNAARATLREMEYPVTKDGATS